MTLFVNDLRALKVVRIEKCMNKSEKSEPFLKISRTTNNSALHYHRLQIFHPPDDFRKVCRYYGTRETFPILTNYRYSKKMPLM